jgi:putative methyltransferase
MKNVYFLSFSGHDVFVPVLWPSAKTFYEKYGKHPSEYNWISPSIEFHEDIDFIKASISKNPPSIFGVSLYVWNFEKSLSICKWVRDTFPECIIITGGPHQYFKHDLNWFKKHYFIDASLPSEVYGEIAITDILDNFKDGKVKWNAVEKMVYPTAGRQTYMQSSKATYQLEFKWDFSAFKSQEIHIVEYVNQYKKLTNKQPHAKLETTRGCPYACTFCDWGGGVGSKMVKKSYNNVIDDINVLLSLDITSLYICDSNFGINGQRDVDIIQYISDLKKSRKFKEFPNIQYGGFAKTTKHFDYLKQIFTIEAKSELSYVYKISLQSFDTKILDNVKRTDLRSTEHWELATYLRETYNYEAIVELIFGLPGITKDIWYSEFNIPYKENVLVRAYEWHLLPEAESYSPAYREKYGIKTARKIVNSHPWSIPSEIVVESNSYSRKDYKEMMIAYSIYTLFVQSGIYNKSIRHYLKTSGTEFGEFLKRFYQECYPLIKQDHRAFDHFEIHLDNFIFDGINNAQLSVKWPDSNSSIEILLWAYFILEYFKNFETIDPIVSEWLIHLGFSSNIVTNDSLLIHSEKRMNTVKRKWFTKIKYDNFDIPQDLLTDLNGTGQYYYGKILVGRSTFF